MKPASKDTRERALAAFKNGVKIDEICKAFGICGKTLYIWRKREAEGGEQVPKAMGIVHRRFRRRIWRELKNCAWKTVGGNTHKYYKQLWMAT